MELVSVQFEFEYTTKDGRLVSIKPNESYILVSKTNEHWWHVRKDQHTRPFYVPAQYMKELPSLTDSPGPNKLDSPERVTNSKPVDMANKTPATTVIRVSTQDASRERCRFSTFGLCEDIPDVKPWKTLKDGQTTSSFAHTLDNIKTSNSTGDLSFPVPPPPLNTDCLQLYAKPHCVPKVRNGRKQSKSSLQDDKVERTFLQDEDMDFPPPPMNFPQPPNSPIYDTIPELNIPEFNIFELPAAVASDDTLMFEQQNSTQTAEAPSSTDAPPIEQVITFFIVFIHYSVLVSLKHEINMCHCGSTARRGRSFIM